VLLEIDVGDLGWFGRFVQRVNRAPILWTVGLLVPVYIFCFALAFIALIDDPYVQSPITTFLLLLIAATTAMSYHWFFARYQRSSMLGQVIQFVAGLSPIVGGFFILTISRMAG